MKLQDPLIVDPLLVHPRQSHRVAVDNVPEFQSARASHANQRSFELRFAWLLALLIVVVGIIVACNQQIKAHYGLAFLGAMWCLIFAFHFADERDVVRTLQWKAPLPRPTYEVGAPMHEFKVDLPQESPEQAAHAVLPRMEVGIFVSAIGVFASMTSNLVGSIVTVVTLPGRNESAPLDFPSQVLPWFECVSYWVVLANMCICIWVGGQTYFQPIVVAWRCRIVANFSTLTFLGMAKPLFSMSFSVMGQDELSITWKMLVVTWLWFWSIAAAVGGLMAFLLKIRGVAFVQDVPAYEFSVVQWAKVLAFLNNVVNFRSRFSIIDLGQSDAWTMLFEQIDMHSVGGSEDKVHWEWLVRFQHQIGKAHSRFSSVVVILGLSQDHVKQLFNQHYRKTCKMDWVEMADVRNL